MLHRRLFTAPGGFDETLPAAEDYDLWLQLAWRYPVGLVPEPWLEPHMFALEAGVVVQRF